VATSLKPQLGTGREASAYEVALTLTSGDVAAYWRPTAANYLGRVTRDRLLAIGGELFGEPWTQSRRGDKKKDLAAELERAFAEPAKHARKSWQKELLTRWLPAGMAFGSDAAAVTQEEARTAA
jgi:ParB family transcriptional regulator, chromosome partitioning protein